MCPAPQPPPPPIYRHHPPRLARLTFIGTMLFFLSRTRSSLVGLRRLYGMHAETWGGVTAPPPLYYFGYARTWQLLSFILHKTTERKRTVLSTVLSTNRTIHENTGGRGGGVAHGQRYCNRALKVCVFRARVMTIEGSWCIRWHADPVLRRVNPVMKLSQYRTFGAVR